MRGKEFLRLVLVQIHMLSLFAPGDTGTPAAIPYFGSASRGSVRW